VDLNELVVSLKPMLTQLLREDVALRVELDPSPCLANVDPVQVETALMNLGVNGRDAMPGGGHLVIKTGRVVLDQGSAGENEDVIPGVYAIVSVTDTGVGIASENMARLFEPFYTTKGPGQGTGLGLSMVYGFVRQSDGHVKVESELGRGTVVTLHFPAAQANLPVQPADPEVQVVRGGGETILLVEDEDGVRELAAETLEALGYRVIAMPDGPAALERARRESRIDLLFTDVLLPKGMNGRQLAQELTRERPLLRVLYASGYSEDIVEHRGQLEPGLGFLPKPYARERLAQAVRAALRGDPPPRPPGESTPS
jgi:CheY-like chemotaxis protein